MVIEMDENFNIGARLKVIGVGGCGGNAVNTMIESGLDGIEFLIANTDSQALDKSLAGIRVQLGASLTAYVLTYTVLLISYVVVVTHLAARGAQ